MDNDGPMIPLGFFSEIITMRNRVTGVEHHFSADWSSAELQAFIKKRPSWQIRMQEVLTPFHDAEEIEDDIPNPWGAVSTAQADFEDVNASNVYPEPTNPEAWVPASGCNCDEKIQMAKAEVFAVMNELSANLQGKINHLISRDVQTGRDALEVSRYFDRRISKIERKFKIKAK